MFTKSVLTKVSFMQYHTVAPKGLSVSLDNVYVHYKVTNVFAMEIIEPYKLSSIFHLHRFIYQLLIVQNG